MVGNIGVLGVAICIYYIYIALFKGYNKLFSTLFITSILTTTTVVNFGASSITVPHVIAAIYGISIIFKLISGKLKIFKIDSSLPIFIYYSIFIATIKSIFFSSESFNIAQLIYLGMLFSVFYFTYILIKNKKIDYLDLDMGMRKSIKLLSICCFIQVVNFNLFSLLFRNTVGQSFISTLEDGTLRVTGPFNEPSMLATILSIGLVYFTFTAFKRHTDWIYVGVIFLIGSLSKGSTFIMAIFIWGIIIVIYYLRKLKIFKVINLILFILFLTVFINIKFDNVIGKEIVTMVMKISGEGVSGNQRIATFISSIDIFKNNFFLGVGFGVNRSGDLFSTSLSNYGVIGASIFSLFFYKVFKIKTGMNSNQKAIKISLGVCMILMLISVPELYYNYIWIFTAYSYTSITDNKDSYI